MANVAEAKTNYLKVKKAVEDCQRAIAGLQTKRDTLGESLPGLSRAVEDAEKTKTAALDNFAMTSNKTTESALKATRGAHEAALKAYSEGKELAEATHRALTKRQAEFLRFNNAYDLARRELWQAIAGEIRSRIPEGVISDIQRLIVVGTQTGKTRQFIISELLPNLNPSEYQTIRDEMIEKYGIAD